MKRLRKTTARSAKRKLAVALLGVAALSGAGAVFAAGGKPDFSIAASPGSQTVSQGAATTYTVTVTRQNGFSGSVSLAISNLPTGASASWKLSDGTSSSVVPPSLNSATLKIQTSSTTPNATSQPVITATSGKLSHSIAITLVVQPTAQPNFAVTGSPASQPVPQGADASYTVRVNRTGGFSESVDLSVSGLPKGATASWIPGSTVPGTSSETALQIQTASNTQTGTYALAITGTGTIGGSAASRSSAVVLDVQRSQSFQIEGNLGAQLAPGRRAPLNLSLTNPYNFALTITGLAVAVEEETSKTGCSGTQNFEITQVPSARYPISLPAGQTRTLADLGVADADMPQVEMVNRPWNQDACKGATISLDYSGSAGK